MEIIVAMGRPTISEFSKVSKMSGSNCAYRIKKLVEKGYIIKSRNEADKREFYLEPTGKYNEEYGLGQTKVRELSNDIKKSFSADDINLFDKMLTDVERNLMSALPEYLRNMEMLKD